MHVRRGEGRVGTWSNWGGGGGGKREQEARYPRWSETGKMAESFCNPAEYVVIEKSTQRQQVLGVTGTGEG